jgi:hypothetical protein
LIIIFVTFFNVFVNPIACFHQPNPMLPHSRSHSLSAGSHLNRTPIPIKRILTSQIFLEERNNSLPGTWRIILRHPNQTNEEQKRIQLKTNRRGTSANNPSWQGHSTLEFFHRVFQLVFPVFVWILWFCAFTWCFWLSLEYRCPLLRAHAAPRTRTGTRTSVTSIRMCLGFPTWWDIQDRIPPSLAGGWNETNSKQEDESKSGYHYSFHNNLETLAHTHSFGTRIS